MTDFRDRFIESQGKPILHDGQEIHLAYPLPVRNGEVLRMVFLDSTPQPVQGLRLIAKNCELEAVGQRAKQFVLWADTVTEHAEIRPVKVKSGAQIRLMNVWRDEKFGSTLHGLNFSGMRLELQSNDTFVLHCSDGWGPPSFDDLVVRVTHEHEGG